MFIRRPRGLDVVGISVTRLLRKKDKRFYAFMHGWDTYPAEGWHRNRCSQRALVQTLTIPVDKSFVGDVLDQVVRRGGLALEAADDALRLPIVARIPVQELGKPNALPSSA